MRHLFQKNLRLCKRSEFKHVRESGRPSFGSFLIIEKRELASNSMARLGITASKKYGKAHERNRFKRIAREAFRLSCDKLPRGIEIVLKPKPRAKEATTLDLIQELLALLNS